MSPEFRIEVPDQQQDSNELFQKGVPRDQISNELSKSQSKVGGELVFGNNRFEKLTNQIYSWKHVPEVQSVMVCITLAKLAFDIGSGDSQVSVKRDEREL